MNKITVYTLIGIMGIIFLSMFIFLDLLFVPLAVLGGAASILILIYPRTSILFFIVWTFIQNLPRSYLPGGFIEQTDLIDEFILILLTIRWLVPVVLGKKKLKRTPIDIPLLFFLAFYIVSVIANDVPILNSIFAFRDVFQYVLLLYIYAHINFTTNDLSRHIQIVYYVALANFLVLAVQVAVFFSKTGTLFIEDEGVGLMGISGAHKLGYFAGILLVGYAARPLVGLKIKWQWFLVLAFIIAITSARAIYFWVPLSLLFIYGRKILSNPKWITRALILVLAFAGLILIYINLPITRSATINPVTLFNQQLGTKEGASLRRVGFLEYSWNVLLDHNPLVGVGPGNYVSKTPSRLGSALYTKYNQDFPFTNAFTTGSQLSLTIVEYGIIGSVLVIWVYLAIYRACTQWSKRFVEPHIRALAYGVIGMLVFIALSTVSINIFELQEVVSVPWIFLGILISFRNLVRSDPSAYISKYGKTNLEKTVEQSE